MPVSFLDRVSKCCDCESSKDRGKFFHFDLPMTRSQPSLRPAAQASINPQGSSSLALALSTLKPLPALPRKDTGFRPKSAAGITEVGAPPLFMVSGCPRRSVEGCSEKLHFGWVSASRKPPSQMSSLRKEGYWRSFSCFPDVPTGHAMLRWRRFSQSPSVGEEQARAFSITRSYCVLG